MCYFIAQLFTDNINFRNLKQVHVFLNAGSALKKKPWMIGCHQFDGMQTQ